MMEQQQQRLTESEREKDKVSKELCELQKEHSTLEDLLLEVCGIFRKIKVERVREPPFTIRLL